VRAKQKT